MLQSIRLIARTFVLASSSLAFLATPLHAQYVVNSTLDEPDLAPGDGACQTASGVCTLRAAVQESNVAAGLNTISLPAGVFRLTIAGPDEDTGATGDLDVSGELVIEGVRAFSSVIDGGGLDRVFDQRAGLLALKRLTVRNGSAEHGGGIRSAVPMLVLEDAVVRDNYASGNGGGIFASYPARITNSTIALNRAGRDGGGLYLSSTAAGAHELLNSTISSNVAGVSGGGLFAAGTTGTAQLTHVTLHLNAAPSGASVQTASGASVALRNSVISAAANNCSGTMSDAGGNVAASVCGSLPIAPTLFSSVDALGFYHPPFTPGPTLGHGLAAGSPAIGAASGTPCAATDQRGLPRPEGGSCDAGAFEYSAPNGLYDPTPAGLTLSPVGDQTIRVGTSTTALRVVATNSPVPVEQLVLTGRSSNATVVPPGAIRIVREADGVWSVRVFATPFATGIVSIELSAVSFEPDDMGRTTFALNVVGADGTAGGNTAASGTGVPPQNVAITPSGAGAVVSWQGSSDPSVRHYAVSGGSTPAASDLPVLLTAGTETSLTIPALPAGVYSLRVHAIGENGVTEGSPATPANIGSAQAPGIPYGITAVAFGNSVEIGGRGPAAGAPPSAYRVEFGSTPGTANVASASPTAAPFVQTLGNGFHWVQARALSGAVTGTPSSSFGVRIGSAPGGCNEEPHAPILLPPTVNGSTLTLTWLPAATGPDWRSFVLERSAGPFGFPIETLAITSQATTYAIDVPAGLYYYRVAAENGCGVGRFSNLAGIAVP